MVFYRISISSLLVALVALQHPAVLPQLDEILYSCIWTEDGCEDDEEYPEPDLEELNTLLRSTIHDEYAEIISPTHSLSYSSQLIQDIDLNTYRFGFSQVCFRNTLIADSYFCPPSHYISPTAHFPLPLRI